MRIVSEAASAGGGVPPAVLRGGFEFTSTVSAAVVKEVEALFYFHPRQRSLMEPIRASIEAFGVPEILRRGDRIHVGIPKNGAQCLFACHPDRRPGVPVAAAVYLRTSDELIHVLHLAVSAPYAQGGRFGDLGLAMQMINEVRRLARRISGVRRVQLPYRRSSIAVPRLAPDWALSPVARER